MKMFTGLLMAVVGLLLLVLPGMAAAAGDEVTLSSCVVSLVDEAQVPAQEAGVIMQLKPVAGARVEKGDLLVQIDDAKPQMEYRVAAAKLSVAKEKATDDINVRYAIASAKVAESAYNTAEDANRRVPGSVPKTEMQTLWLKWKEATLGIEKAQLEQRVAVQEAKVAQA
jgi:multidrug resistance efflux pump